MTDKKALEVLKSWLQLAYHNADGTDECCAELYEALQTMFALINRQQAKIERLKKENKILSINADTAFQDGLNYAEQMKAGIKSESVKEFAERLKNKIEIDLSCGVDSAYYLDDVLFNDIDNLAKEMVGTKNEN